jgi:hypothetical protein
MKAANLQSTFESYLVRLGRFEEQSLGPRAKTSRAASAEDAAWLRVSLREVKASQRRLFGICVVVLCVIFALQVVLLLYSVFAKNPVGSVAGGVVVVFLPVLWWLRRLWIDSFILHLAEKIGDELPPEQQVKMIEILYWGSLTKSKRFVRDK